MRAGTLNQLIRFERPNRVVDPAYGPQPSTWEEVDTVWANVQDVLPSRSESVAAGIRIAARPARIRIRYRDDITSDMRIVLLDRGNRVMQIVAGPAELGNREGIELMATEYSTSGDAA